MQVAVVGVPGTLANWRAFAPLFSALQKHGAVGQTFVVETGRWATAAAAADACLSQINERKIDKFVLVGFSLGVSIAAQMAAKNPGRVLGLVLLDMNGEADNPGNAAGRRAAVEISRELGLSEFVLKKLWNSHVAKSNLRDKNLLAEIQLMAEESGVGAFANQMEIAISRPRTIDVVAELTVPALIFCGAEDVITPPQMSIDVAKTFADSKLTILPDAGHFAILEQADAIAQIVAPWLNSIGGNLLASGQREA